MIRFDAEERETLRQARAIRRREVKAAKSTREAQEATERKAMTAKRRREVIERDGEVCRYPECEITAGLDVDHIVCLELGGKDALPNLQLLCGDHHRQKTALDAKLIAKARRLRKAAAAPRQPSKIRSPGFQAASRPFAEDRRR
jgi:5-methylcytosine-specific restriction endonuclease McrA